MDSRQNKINWHGDGERIFAYGQPDQEDEDRRRRRDLDEGRGGLDDSDEGLDRRFEGAAVDSDHEPFARVALRSPGRAQMLGVPADEGAIAFRFTPSARDSQLSQPQDDEDFMEDREAVLLERKPKPRAFLEHLEDEEEDILDEQALLQRRPKPELAQTSGQLIDAEFLEDDFANARHFSVHDKVQGGHEEVIAATVDPLKKCTSQLSKQQQAATNKDQNQGEEYGLDGASNRRLSRSKGRSSIDDSLNQRASNPSLDYQLLVGPSPADGAERDKGSDPFHARGSPAADASFGRKNSKTELANSAMISPAMHKEVKGAASPPPSKTGTRKNSKTATNQSLNQSYGPKGRALAAKLAAPKASSSKSKGVTSTTRNGSAKTGNFFRSPKQTIEHTKPGWKVVRPSTVVAGAAECENNKKSIANAGETGQTFNNIFSHDNLDDVHDRADSELESPAFTQKVAKKKRNSVATAQAKTMPFGSKARTSKAASRKNTNLVKDLDQSREFPNEGGDPQRGAPSIFTRQHSRIENEGGLPHAPSQRSTPKHGAMFAVGPLRGTPTPQRPSPFKAPRKSSNVQKQQALKASQARDFQESQLNEQKARTKPKTLRCSPQNKNAPASTKFGTLRGSRGSGSKVQSHAQTVLSPHAAQYAISKMERSIAVEGALPGSASTSGTLTVAQRLALSALRRQQLKAGSPQLVRSDLSKSQQKQALAQVQERRKKLLHETQTTFPGSEQKVTPARHAISTQHGSVQSTTKPKSALKPKVHTSPDHLARPQGPSRGPTLLGSNSAKKPGGIRLKATTAYNSVNSQTPASVDQELDSTTPKQSIQSRKDLADPRFEQARHQRLNTDGSRQEIKSAFLDKLSAHPRPGHERNQLGMAQDADITQSQEHMVRSINVSNKNNKRKEAKQSLDGQEVISNFAQQDGVHRLRRRQQQAEDQKQALFVKSQPGISKAAEGKSPITTAEALKTNTQFTADEEEAAGSGDKVVGTLGALLGVFGVSGYDGKDFSFSHGGAKYRIDIGKLALELHGHALAAGKISEASKQGLGSLPLLNSVSLADHEILRVATDDLGARANNELNAALRETGPKTPNEKSLRDVTDPLAGITAGVGATNPGLGPRNWLNTDRPENNNQDALNGMDNKSQRPPGMHLDPEALRRPKNAQQATPSGEADALVQKLNPKRMRSVTNHKSRRSNDQESTGRPASNYSKGFQQVRDQHQDRLKLSRLRTNSRQQLQQRMRSNDSKNPALQESKSNQGSFVESVQKQPTLAQQQPPLQVRQMQTEAQNIQNHAQPMGIRHVRSSTEAQGFLDPSLIQARSQMTEPRFLSPLGAQSVAKQGGADGPKAFNIGQNAALPDGTGSHPDQSPSLLQTTESNPTTPLAPTPSIHQQSSPHSAQQPEQTHLAFLFASPLMLKTSDGCYFDVLPPISFEDEFEQIKQSIEEKKIQFNYRYQVATSVNLLKILRENPVGLHFSGHGFKNTEAIYEGDKKAWKKNQNKGDVLIFENEDGSSEFFFQNDLDKMFKNVAEQLNRLEAQREEPEAQRQDQGKQQDGGEDTQLEDIQLLERTIDKLKDRPTNLQFVFVASCHAEKVAEIFLKIGVPHVICINQNQRILDKAAVDFSKFFYDEVFDKFCTICEAYANAKQQLENIYGSFHANKVLLKTCDGHDVKNCAFKDHRQQRKHGFLKRLDEESHLNYFPNKVRPFLFRNRDMFDVLKLLTEHKIVQIFGLPGLGKSSLLKNVTVYLGERNYYKDGLIYIDLRHITTFQEALKIVSLYLHEGDDNEHDQFQLSFNPDHAFNETVSIKRILGPLKHFMFAFDNIDHLEKNEYTRFVQFMIDLAQNTKVKFLFTSERYQPSLFQGDIGVKLLKRLTHHESVELFLTKIPLSDTDRTSYFEFGNIRALHEQTAAFYKDLGITKDLPKICSLRNCPHTFSTCVKKYLMEHPMFEFFMGTPLVISIVAPFTVCKSLKEICIDLWQRSKEQSSSADGENIKSTEILQDEIYYKSLLDSLDYCTKHFQEQGQGGNSPILEMWYIIGLNGPGILQDDLKAIICAGKDQDEARRKQLEQASDEQNPFVQFDKNLDDLTKFSVIESENVDVAGRVKRLKVGPMINDYINQKLDHEFKATTLQIVCVQIRDVLVELKKWYSEEIVKCTLERQIKQREDELADKVKLYEQQIMHLVYQAIKMQKMQEDDDDSLHTDESMEEEEQERLAEMFAQQTGENSGPPQPRIPRTKRSSQAPFHEQKSIKSAGGKQKPRKQNHEVKPHVSKSFLAMRMTLKHDQINKLRADDLEDEDAECEVDQDERQFKMLKKATEERAGSEILKNQVRPVRQMGPSARDNTAYRAQSVKKKNQQARPKDKVEDLFEEHEEPTAQRRDDQNPQDMSRPNLHDLLPIREVSDDNIVLSLKDGAEDLLVDNIFDSAFPDPKLAMQQLRDLQQNKDEPGSKSPRRLITASRRHQPFEPSADDAPADQRDGPTASKIEKQSTYKWSAVSEEQQQDEVAYDWSEDSSRSSQADGAEAQQRHGGIQEANESDESDQQKGKQLNHFLADHQRVMVEEGKEDEDEKNAHHFNNTVSPAEIAKQLNQRLFQEVDDSEFANTLQRLTWRNLASRISSKEQAPDREKQKRLRKRQNTLLKRVDQIKYDVNESTLFRIRQSVMENSFSKNHRNLVNQLNPDIGKQPQEVGVEAADDVEKALEIIAEQQRSGLEEECEAMAVPTLGKNKSQQVTRPMAQQKLRSHHTEVEARSRGPNLRGTAQDAGSVHSQHIHEVGLHAKPKGGYKAEKLYELQIYEELFFQYLSILALIPKERPKVLVILDTFKTRNYQPQDTPSSTGKNKEAPGSKSTFNILQSEAQKKLIEDTFIEIPEQSKLLRANTLMLELYVQIKEDMMALMDYMNIDAGAVRQPGHFNRADPVYEKASEIRSFFEELQFVRGLAMLDYVQAMRKLQRNKNLKEFKERIQSSALQFEQAHEVCGIQQCIELAKRALRVKPAEEGDGSATPTAASLKKRQLKSDTEELEGNSKCIQALERSLQNLTDCSDYQVQSYVRYRQENKIPNLAARLKPKRAGKNGNGQPAEVIQVDKVLNMLLNPQCQLTLTTEI